MALQALILTGVLLLVSVAYTEAAAVSPVSSIPNYRLYFFFAALYNLPPTIIIVLLRLFEGSRTRVG